MDIVASHVDGDVADELYIRLGHGQNYRVPLAVDGRLVFIGSPHEPDRWYLCWSQVLPVIPAA